MINNVLLLYFSGTGNTRRVALEYKKSFVNNGCSVTLKEITIDDNIDDIDLKSFDLIGFGYPIHAFNAPKNILRLAKNLPVMNKDKKAFIFKSSGEPVRMSDISSLKLIHILKKKRIIVSNEYQYCMPYNIIFRHSNSMAYKMIQTLYKLVPLDVKEIIDGKPRKVKYLFCGSILAWFLRIEHWGARFNGHHYKVDNNCIHCHLCEKICPTKNIVIDENGRFHFKKNCLMCMRCTMNCPQDAIRAGFFNGWKVNGNYTFEYPSQEEQNLKSKHDNYCKKAYDRYFEIAEQRINQANIE